MFRPIYTITTELTNLLLKINQLKKNFIDLPITPKVLVSLRESARLNTIHYSTKIEGNKLTIQEIEEIIKLGKTFPGKKRDEKEVLGYHAALNLIKEFYNKNKPLTENTIQEIHSLVMGIQTNNKKKQILYRDGQNAVYDGDTKKIVYLPPEAHDVPKLTHELIEWINNTEKNDLATPLIAAIAHYQFVTIHPYYDGNGRTARLLATLILHRGGYDLKGIYSLEEYYAKNLSAYYNAISIGPSHNYYMGRNKADISSWIIYFLKGLLQSFEDVKTYALIEYGKKEKDESNILRNLDSKQQAILTLFKKRKIITNNDVSIFLNVSKRTARALCQKWVEEDFLVINDFSKKGRKYKLNQKLEDLF